MSRNFQFLLQKLEGMKAKVGEADPRQLIRLLKTLGRLNVSQPLLLARFHDALLFLRAFPPDVTVLRQVEIILRGFAARVANLKKQGVDLSDIEDHEEYSGIAGTTLTAFLGYDEVAWLVKRFPGRVSIDWESYEPGARMAAALPRFLPLFEDDARVEADVPYRRWLEIASGRRELEFLVDGFQRMTLSPDERVELFGALELPIRWELGNSRASRTLSRRPVRGIYFHREPLLLRRDVSIAGELAKSNLKIEKLSVREGKEIIDLCREATTVRYRELYGTSLGDPSSVVRAGVGRGVEIFLWGLTPDRRLPLRAYQAGFTLKNGVPINYIEGIALFEWMEIGFNTFYAYRDGETAWIYAQVLRMLHQVLGVTCVSVYPYQIGKDNTEAIQSGAFWFYRKLGFRPMRPELAKVVAAEEKKIAKDPKHRTSVATLKKLAEGHVVFEMAGSAPGKWDRFAMKNIGFAVQRRMARQYDGDSGKIRAASGRQVARALGVHPENWPKPDQAAFENLALVWALIPDLPAWKPAEKAALVRMARAKATDPEPRYLQMMQAHSRLRTSLLRLGTSGKVPLTSE